MECYAAIKECHRFVCSDIEKYLKETSHKQTLMSSQYTEEHPHTSMFFNMIVEKLVRMHRYYRSGCFSIPYNPCY